MPDDPRDGYAAPGEEHDRSLRHDFDREFDAARRRQRDSLPLAELWQTLKRRRKLAFTIEGGLLALCLLYCLVAPDQYESSAKVELRSSPASPLSIDGTEPLISTSILSAPMELETVAGVLRSDSLAWRVINKLRLYDAPGFRSSFTRRFPGFRVDAPTPEAQAWLLERFARRLRVESIPRTLLIDVRFRSRDAALSAAVVNALIEAYGEQDSEGRMQATAQASQWLQEQLRDLKAQVERDDERLAAFQNAHGIVSTPGNLPTGEEGETQHDATALESDEMGRQLVAATAERILSEAEYRAASQGDPEMVLAANPNAANGMGGESGGLTISALQQIRARRSDLQQEAAQLSAEHGPNFPRVVEIGRQLQDLDRQKQAEDATLVERFRSNWQTALEREQLLKESLQKTTAEALARNRAATEYAAMRQEANASHELYMRVLGKMQEAGMSAGVHDSNLSVVDFARQPVRPVAPNLPLYMAITFFAGLWVTLGGVLMAEKMRWWRPRVRAGAVAVGLLAALAAAVPGRAQAPTPSTSGLPAGVATLPASPENRPLPNPKEAPMVWNGAAAAGQAGVPLPVGPLGGVAMTSTPMPAPIAPGDLLDVSESHTPEFHSAVRVSAAGTVTLPMVSEVAVGGMDERAAARAIDDALVAKGMLLHPVVTVLVTSYVGEDVSVLGEVARPGVYPYTVHHRLLDLISAASGLGPNAGRLVNIFHASDSKTAHPVVLDPGGTDRSADHNPELSPGDTVEVSRAGLVYVVGDVIRPGGFAVDPVQGLTVVQALSLAWGPSQNAAANKAILIREQKGGRTMTVLNLKRMLHGQDPDQLVEDRDILYVPDSTARNLWNRTMESAIQSTIGVTLYSGLVYSQRY